jgi:Ca-activated chloride channel homolog
MKTLRVILLFFTSLFVSTVIFGQISTENDKTLSPYFYILSDEEGAELLPLKSTSAQVNISGVIADVTVSQVYRNAGKKPIEAIYVFPASTRAAVYSMVMTIGERVIIARVEEREKARQEYEEARKNGKSASLLEQERPNVFTMNVANIMPGEEIIVQMKYTEVLLPVDRVYEFIYPTVVGPRYSGNAEDLAYSGDNWNTNPYTVEGIDPLYEFDIKVSLSTGILLKDITCPSHKTDIVFKGKGKADVTLSPSEAYAGNRDFILKYRLAGQQIESGVLLYQGEKENFFLAMVQPPDRVLPEMVPPREYIFIVDVSGSMYGYPLEISKKLLKDLINGLKPTDRFNVILFAGGSDILAGKSLTASKENISSAISFIEKENGGGGTELLPALKLALSLEKSANYSRTFIIATDGYVTIEKEAFDLVRRNLGNANIFAFGIGTSVNRFLLEGLAHAGQGEPFIITKQEEAPATADKFRKYISQPLLTDIHISFNDFEAYDLAQESYPDVFAERPVIIFGKYKGKPGGSVVISGNDGNSVIENKIDLASAQSGDFNSGLRYLWAREKIRYLDDYANSGYEDEASDDQLLALGLEYNLLTRLTSFIAIDSETRNSDGNYTTIRQPLPLPEGVSNYAVGRAVGGVSSGNGHMTKAECSAATEEIALDYEGNNNPSEIVVPPEFRGGEKAMEEFIRRNLIYPAESAKNNISGTVIVEFTVDTDGSVNDIRILYSLDKYTDQEVARVVNLMKGMWKPAECNGKKVKASVIIKKFVFRP